MAHGNATHGMFGTATYSVWGHMMGRCNNPTDAAYADYGGRGIKVCPRWYAFQNFLADMGEKPKGMTLERKDTNKGYITSNCIWASRAAQARNRRYCKHVTFNGKTMTIAEWAVELGFPRTTLYRRLDRGESMLQIIQP